MSKDNSNVIKIVCVSDGMNSDRNGIVTVRFKAPFEGIADWLKLFGFIGIDLVIGAKSDEDDKSKKLGNVRLKKISTDKEGEAQLHFYGDNVDVTRMQLIKEKIITLAVKVDPEGNGA